MAKELLLSGALNVVNGRVGAQHAAPQLGTQRCVLSSLSSSLSSTFNCELLTFLDGVVPGRLMVLSLNTIANQAGSHTPPQCPARTPVRSRLFRTFDFQLSTVDFLPDMQYRMPQKVAGSKYADHHHSRPQNQPQKRPSQFLLVVSRFSRKNSLSRLVWSGFCSL